MNFPKANLPKDVKAISAKLFNADVLPESAFNTVSRAVIEQTGSKVEFYKALETVKQHVCESMRMPADCTDALTLTGTGFVGIDAQPFAFMIDDVKNQVLEMLDRKAMNALIEMYLLGNKADAFLLPTTSVYTNAQMYA